MRMIAVRLETSEWRRDVPRGFRYITTVDRIGRGKGSGSERNDLK